MNSYRLKDISVGMVHEFTAAISREMLVQFIQISGDNNPLHADSDYAVARGFKDSVVHGMLSSSLYSRLIGVYLPGKYCLLQGMDISFKKPVFPDDELCVSGEVVYINEAYKQIEIKAKISNQEKQIVSKAKIKIGLLDE